MIDSMGTKSDVAGNLTYRQVETRFEPLPSFINQSNKGYRRLTDF
jgi:hypothetical protein